MNNIKITVELCKEDRQRVDELIGMAGWIVGALKDMAAAAPEPKRIPAEEEHPADASTAPFDLDQPPVDPDPAPEAKPVSFPEFQKVVTQVVAKGPKQKAAAKEIISKYAASVSGVPEDKRAEVMAELAKI